MKCINLISSRLCPGKISFFAEYYFVGCLKGIVAGHCQISLGRSQMSSISIFSSFSIYLRMCQISMMRNSFLYLRHFFCWLSRSYYPYSLIDLRLINDHSFNSPDYPCKYPMKFISKYSDFMMPVNILNF